MHLYNIFESSSFEPETIEYKGWRYVPELLVGDDVTKKVHHVFDPSGTELLSPENPFDNADSKLYGPYGAWATEQDFQKYVDSKHTEPAAQIAKPEPEVDEEFANEPGRFDVELKPVRVKKTQAFDETKPVEAYGFIEEDGERKYWSREFPNYAALNLWSRRNRADVAGISNKSDTGVPPANEFVIYVDGQKKFTCATEKEAEQKLLRVKHKYPDKEFEIRQRSMVLTSALREAARVGNTYSDDVPGRTGVGISSDGSVSETKKKTSTDKSNTQTKQELCPSCSSADVKTYSSGEKECNQCHKTWAVKDVSENCDDFHCKLRQKVKQRAASDQADLAIAQARDPSKWLWKPGDQVYSKKTGKTYSIIGRTLDRKHGAMYLYQHGEEGSDDYEQGRFIADKAHNSLVKIADSEEEHDEWNDIKEASDISGLLAASHLNKQFRIQATATDNGKPFSKSYKVKAQSARVAKEKLMRYLTTGDRVLSDVELGDAVEITSGKIKEAGETRHVLYLNGKAAAHYATYPNTKVDIKPVQAGLIEGLRDPKDNPCWKGYHPVGTKKKGGRKVPNCVPKSK